MGREIKFELWLLDGNAMLSKEVMTLEEIIECEFIYHTVDKKRQFTGLKDKNGNDVFEGDIVSFSNNRINQEYRDVIVWNAFDNDASFNVKSPMINIFDEAIEVIGNIYENKNLL